MNYIYRRNLLTGSAMFAGIAALGTSTKAAVPAGRDPFDYEVTRTEDEWRAMLGEDFCILREGETERPRSSQHWAEAREGMYNCRGCDLPQYSSFAKVSLLKGWAFFTASEPNAQMMSKDGPAIMAESGSAHDIAIEVHCRRCGSHMGHILLVEGKVLHCINGASLNFEEATT